MKKSKSILIRVVTPDILKELDELASSRHISRSAVIRNLLANSKICYQFLESEWQAQKPEMVKLENKLAEEMLDALPPEYVTPETTLVMSRIFRKISEAVR